MSVLALVEPLRPSVVGGTFEGATRLASASPREVAVTAGGSKTIDVDFGQPVAFDVVFLGYTNAGSGLQFSASCGLVGYAEQALPPVQVAASRLSRRRHLLSVAAQPTTARYLRLSGANLAAGLELGVLVVGRAIRPSLGHEWGGGRFVVDTGSATRLPGGGFGISPGARAGGWQWTLGDLTDDEVDAIYGLQLAVGTSRSLLVVEDPDQTSGLNERIHWGFLTRLDPYERRAPGATKWDLRIEDWA